MLDKFKCRPSAAIYVPQTEVRAGFRDIGLEMGVIGTFTIRLRIRFLFAMAI